MIEVAGDNFTGDAGVFSEDLKVAQSHTFGLNVQTDLHPIVDRTRQVSSGSWSTLRWSRIHDGRIYYKNIGVAPELPPSWATHIYKPLTF